LLKDGAVSPHEAFMKAIDKNLFKRFLPQEEAGLAYSAGAAPYDERRPAGDFIKGRANWRPAADAAAWTTADE
jgi:hypothetical protein